MAAQAHDTLIRTSLSVEQSTAAAWAVTPDHETVVGGPRAVALFLAVAWNTKLPLLPWKVPGMPWLLDRVYELIAANRYRFPGDTPWCVEHPGECAEATT